MDYHKELDVVCLADPKQSALFFDRIFPISYILEQIHTQQEIDIKIVSSLTGKDIHDKADAFFKKLYNEFSSFYRKLLAEGVVAKWQMPKELKEIMQRLPNDSSGMAERFKLGVADRYLTIPYSFVHTFRYQFSSHPGKNKLPIILPQYFHYFEPKEEDITLSLVSIPLVNTQKTPWEKIIEFREDKEAKRKLRNLRMFLHTNYTGKSRAFIEDDLYRRIEDYRIACKDWGFETKASVLSAILDSKNLRTTMVATAGATLFGEPIVGGAAALAGASVEIGKIALKIAKRKHALHKLKRDHDLAYIIQAKEHLERPS